MFVCFMYTKLYQLSLVEMANEFVAGSSHRECQFGNFRETDL